MACGLDPVGRNLYGLSQQLGESGALSPIRNAVPSILKATDSVKITPLDVTKQQKDDDNHGRSPTPPLG